MNQDSTPLFTALRHYQTRQRYHMPGHKGNLCGPLEAISLLDITELPFSDNLYMPEGIIAHAQQLLADACGSYKAAMVTDGASAAIAVMLGAAVGQGGKLLCARNIHRSVTDACVLWDIVPVFLPPRCNAAGELLPASSAEWETLLAQHPDAKAVLVTSPDYFGRVLPLSSLAETVHAHKLRLLVDEAHGAHLPYFGGLLPEGAAASGADVWVQSMHKTMGALTQGALLHTATDELTEKIASLLPLCCTSSPSYPIMASMDVSRQYFHCIVDKQGFIHKILALRKEIARIDGLSLLPQEEIDITRLTIHCKNRCNGKAAEQFLAHGGIYIEMADPQHLVLILTPYDQDYQPLLEALQKLPYEPEPVQMPSPPPLPVSRLAPRKAMLGEREWLPLKDAKGRIAAVNIGVYPPGIPIFCCGEEMDEAGISYLITLQEQQCTLFGCKNGCCAVVKERMETR